MTSIQLIEILKEGVWITATIHKKTHSAQFLITLRKGTITTNEGVNGINRYSKKRFIANCADATFSIE